MRLLLQALGDPAEEATHAVVHIDPDEVLKRCELLQMVQSKDKELVKVCFWDVVYFFHVDLEKVDPQLEHDFEAECEQWIVLPDGIDTGDIKWKPVRTDCEMIVLHDNVVHWQGYPKYGPTGTISTTSLSYDQVVGLKETTDDSTQQSQNTKAGRRS